MFAVMGKTRVFIVVLAMLAIVAVACSTASPERLQATPPAQQSGSVTQVAPTRTIVPTPTSIAIAESPEPEAAPVPEATKTPDNVSTATSATTDNPTSTLVLNSTSRPPPTATLAPTMAPARGRTVEPTGIPEVPGAVSRTSNVAINELLLSDDEVSGLEAVLGLEISDGDYWYDDISGAFGTLGGPAAGFILPFLDTGGLLRSDASNGDTGVFINGRQLHINDVEALQDMLGVVIPGSYWVDSQGYFGLEGAPTLGNLIFAAREAYGSSAYNSETYGGYIGSDGSTSYYFDPGSGCSVMSGSGVSC